MLVICFWGIFKYIHVYSRIVSMECLMKHDEPLEFVIAAFLVRLEQFTHDPI